MFVYGTLRHGPLRDIVLGAVHDAQDASLANYETAFDQTANMATLRAGKGPTHGVLLTGLDDAGWARLAFYHACFGYQPARVTVSCAGEEHAAIAYAAQQDIPDVEPFDLANWASAWADMACRTAHELLLRQASHSVAELCQMRPFFDARGWANQMAVTPAPQTLRTSMTLQDVDITRRRPSYAGFFRLEAFDLRYRRFDGSWSGEIGRETFVAFDAALVLPYDPVNDTVVIIEQLRFGPIHRGDPAPWVFEPIAGLVDAGEDPAEAARREAVEEAGITLTSLRPMANVYASPGYSSEFFHCFLGLADLTGLGQAEGGLAEENEDIRRHVLPFTRAMELVDSGEINAAPLAMMLMWLALRREELRAAT